MSQAFKASELVGAIVCKEEPTKKGRMRGYVAMLAVEKSNRHLGIGEWLSSPLRVCGEPCLVMPLPVSGSKLSTLAINIMRKTSDEVRGSPWHSHALCLTVRCVARVCSRVCSQVMLETEVVNTGALKLYDNLGFTRAKILPKYYLNGGDAIRLKMWFK